LEFGICDLGFNSEIPMDKIMLAHGSGGKLMHDLIRKLFLKKLSNPLLDELSDAAHLPYKDN
jgi:hydrogenase expression/formation protein HypE